MVLTTILTGMLLVPDLDFSDSLRTAVCATYLGYVAAALLAMNLAAEMKFWKPALTIGLVGVFGALIPGILDQFQNVLIIIGGLFIPAFAVMICDYYLLMPAATTRTCSVRSNRRA